MVTAAIWPTLDYHITILNWVKNNLPLRTSAQPQAPPDNVILLPAALLRRLEGPGVTQVHATLDHHLPGGPASAFTKVSGMTLNLEAKLAGTGLVGDNIGRALDQARQDALYAELRKQYFKHGKVEKIEHRTDLTKPKRGRSGRSVVGTSRNGKTT